MWCKPLSKPLFTRGSGDSDAMCPQPYCCRDQFRLILANFTWCQKRWTTVTSFRVQLLENFDFSHPEDWPKWNQRFQASDLLKEEEESHKNHARGNGHRPGNICCDRTPENLPRSPSNRVRTYPNGANAHHFQSWWTNRRCEGMVVVPKTNDQVRICVDLKRLNERILREFYPLPAFTRCWPDTSSVSWSESI